MATAKATPKKKPAPKTDKKTTAKKATVKKATEKKVSGTKAVAVKKVTAVKKVSPKKAAPKETTKKAEAMSGFERYKMIEVAAYYIAEKNGFAGNTADYWSAAEKEIDKKLAKK